MDTATFHAEINKIVTEHRLDQHPYVKLVNQGEATLASRPSSAHIALMRPDGKRIRHSLCS
jgi:hypothetical protein